MQAKRNGFLCKYTYALRRGRGQYIGRRGTLCRFEDRIEEEAFGRGAVFLFRRLASDEKTHEKKGRNFEGVGANDRLKRGGRRGRMWFGPEVRVLFSEQIPLLIGQVELAEQARKPLIIHCVKAYPDLIRVRKGVKTTVPWIIHGFNNNEQILNQLLEHGFYISVGPQLLNPRSNAFRLLRKIPLYALFLESDDRDVRIEAIYESAASELGIGEEELKRVIWVIIKK